MPNALLLSEVLSAQLNTCRAVVKLYGVRADTAVFHWVSMPVGCVGFTPCVHVLKE